MVPPAILLPSRRWPRQHTTCIKHAIFKFFVSNNCKAPDWRRLQEILPKTLSCASRTFASQVLRGLLRGCNCRRRPLGSGTIPLAALPLCNTGRTLTVEAGIWCQRYKSGLKRSKGNFSHYKIGHPVLIGRRERSGRWPHGPMASPHHIQPCRNMSDRRMTDSNVFQRVRLA